MNLEFPLTNDIALAQPWWLLLALLPLWWWWKYRKKAPDALPVGYLPPHAPLTWRHALMRIHPYLLGLAWVLFCIALAQPRKLLQEEVIRGEGIDIMLTLDYSTSMLAQDFYPNRLEVSKQLASDFILKRRSDRIGLVAFSGEAFTLCPLTTDQVMLSQLLIRRDMDLLEDGTAIGMGLATAVNRLKDSKARSKIVILLTDGDNNAGYLDPQEAALLAKNTGVKVYTIGIGSDGKANIPRLKDASGQIIMGLIEVTLNEPLLKEIAETTGGQYFRAKDASSLKDVYTTIDQLEKSEQDLKTFKRHIPMHRSWVGGGLLLLLLGLFIRWQVLKYFI